MSKALTPRRMWLAVTLTSPQGADKAHNTPDPCWLHGYQEGPYMALPGSKLMKPCVAQPYPSMLRTMVSVLPFFSNLRQLLRCEPKMTV